MATMNARVELPLPQQSAAENVLRALSDPDTVIAAEHILVCGAHPDDETIGCGGQLPRLLGVCICVITDGAPRDLYDAHRYGFSTASAYATARRRELADALSIARVDPSSFIQCNFPDQQAAFDLVRGAELLYAVMRERKIRIVFTHAYEGGHPDHDATACMVHLATRLMAMRRGEFVTIIEMPFYRLSDAGMALQQFDEPSPSSVWHFMLTPTQSDCKRAMIAAHATQRDLLVNFPLEREVFRASPHLDFRELPNRGRLLYEQQPWGMTGTRWTSLASSAYEALGVQP